MTAMYSGNCSLPEDCGVPEYAAASPARLKRERQAFEEAEREENSGKYTGSD